jgi:hypothetical protein
MARTLMERARKVNARRPDGVPMDAGLAAVSAFPTLRRPPTALHGRSRKPLDGRVAIETSLPAARKDL